MIANLGGSRNPSISAWPSVGVWEHEPVTSGAVWSRFTVDPRTESGRAIRASDADRGVVHDVLTSGYADGRLEAAEFEERTDAANAAKTLGELPALIADLVPADQHPPGLTPRSELRQQAEAYYARQRREAVVAMLGPSLICVIIWVATGLGFPWPLFVIGGTGINLVRVLIQRPDIVEERVAKLERRERKSLEKRRRHEVEPPDDAAQG